MVRRKVLDFPSGLPQSACHVRAQCLPHCSRFAVAPLEPTRIQINHADLSRLNRSEHETCKVPCRAEVTSTHSTRSHSQRSTLLRSQLHDLPTSANLLLQRVVATGVKLPVPRGIRGQLDCACERCARIVSLQVGALAGRVWDASCVEAESREVELISRAAVQRDHSSARHASQQREPARGEHTACAHVNLVPGSWALFSENK